ncbi:MAG: hypothetical protein ABIL25_06850 [candidate division WOR-3 bacterium]
MADMTQRIEAWDLKYDTERVKAILDAKRQRMLEHYVAATVEVCEMEAQTRQVLNQAGVHTALYVPYLDYARQLYRLSRVRQVSGNSFALAAQVLLDKWAARGLNPEVLATIRTQVFDIAAPIP